MKLLPALRQYLGVRKDLHRIAAALERIADAQEGITPFRTVEQAEEGPPQIEVVSHDDAYYARLDQLREWYRATHHRDPNPDELCAELDALPVLEEEAAEAIRKKLSGVWPAGRA